MWTVEHMVSAARHAAVWLLMGLVLLAPVGIGASPALAAAVRACAASCPCDAQARDDHENHAADPCTDGDASDEHADGAGSEDPCPDECPDCRCGLGVIMAVVPAATPATALLFFEARVPPPCDRRQSGSCDGVFRPPRS